MSPAPSPSGPHRRTPPTIWSYDRALTRRGVLWLGLKCDLRCKFCYDHNVPASQREWVEPEQARAALSKFRYFYKNQFVDFMGGEPTLHPNVLDIIRYSASIDLLPTCITHALRLSDPEVVQQFADAGIHDFLVSVHGLGAVARQIHGVGYDTWERQYRALQFIADKGIPIRFNVTVIRDNVEQLPDIAKLCADVGGRIVNFITFNPYFEWESASAIPFQVRHAEVAPFLARALDVSTDNGIEANVRYMPLCMLRGYERHMFTNYQLPYDPHEWDLNSWYDQGLAGVPSRQWYLAASDAQHQRHHHVRTAACDNCSVSRICDGLHHQYLARWGAAELAPYTGPVISDPTQFIRNQRKLVYADTRETTPASPTHIPESLTPTQFSEADGYRAGVKRHEAEGPAHHG